MVSKHSTGICQLTLAVFILVLIPSLFGNQNDDKVLSSYKTSNHDTYVAIVHSVTFPEIPESNLYRLGTTIDESILDNPEMATRKTSSFSKGAFTDEQWIGGVSGFNASFSVVNPNPLPTELPDEQKKNILDKSKEWGKSEAETEEYLAETLEAFRKSQERISLGQLDIRIVNAASAKAAFDYLLIETSRSNKGPMEIAREFKETAKIEDLGTIGYGSGAGIRFIRDNIAVVIRADGECMKHAENIARKIDAKLLQQPLLTYEQLQARRPKLHIGPGKKTTPRQAPFLEYSIEAPAGVQAFIRDMTFNGKAIASSDNKVYLEEKPKTVKVEATLVTSELLAFPFENEIEMPDEPGT